MIFFNENKILEIIKQHYVEIPEVKRYNSESCYVAELEFKKFKRVIKIDISGNNRKLSKELYVFEMLNKQNLPSPEIFHIDLSRSKYPQYYIMEHLGSYSMMAVGNLESTVSAELFKQMGGYFARIHSAEFEEQGEITDRGIIKEPFSNGFKRAFEYGLNNLRELDVLKHVEIERCEELFSGFINSDEAVLCHMDYAPCQVILDNKMIRITGIIDWEWSKSSCSALDLARAENNLSFTSAGLDMFIKGYEEIRRLPQNYEETKKVYKIPHLLSALYYTWTNNKNGFITWKRIFDRLIS